MTRLRHRIVADGGRLALEALLGTVRFDVSGAGHHDRIRAAGEQPIFVLWHGRLLPLVYYHRGRDVCTLASRSEDGEYIARVLKRWGYRVVRGSSSRGGGRALRRMVKEARSGRALAFTPDGPRGPRQRMKPGAILAARLTGQPLLPLAAGTDRGWWFEGWDRFLVPQPFARIRLAYGEPMRVPADADATEVERIGQELERTLNALLDAVDGGSAP